jgi:hypothetical protein
MTRIFVEPQGTLPDFRLVVSFLWGDEHDVDSEGNASSPAARDWTELYLRSRERPEEVIEVVPVEGSGLLVVESPLEALAARVAFFLATETDGGVAPSALGPWEKPSSLRPRIGPFSVDDAANRAAASPFRRATLDDPYPNLRA